jgi:hypothetical protein
MSTKIKNHPILLIEDNPVDIDLTLRAFKKQNLTNPIEIARDGEEAINMIGKWNAGKPIPVVILLDLKLPKFNGLEVVVLTSSADDSDINTAYKLGANSYIVKPVQFDRFIEVAAQIELYWTVLNISHIPKI